MNQVNNKTKLVKRTTKNMSMIAERNYFDIDSRKYMALTSNSHVQKLIPKNTTKPQTQNIKV